jgi:peptide deformylase
MYILMKASGGVGLAANQVGLAMQLIVIEAGGEIYKLINPKITKREGSITLQEGCLSFPGIELEVKRSHKVFIEALDQKGKSVSLKPEGVLAVVFQHEIDHINGVTFIDRVSFWQRLKISSKLKKIKKGD